MGCTVKRNRHGYLAFRWYRDGTESLEGTKLKDTPENRRKVEAIARVIDQEMRDGTFDYLRWFPEGNLAAKFRKVAEPVRVITVAGFFRLWSDGNKTKGARPVSAKWLSNRNSYIRTHIVPVLGGVRIDELEPGHLIDLQARLRRSHLSDATIDRVIHSAFRGLLRDAGVAGYRTCDLDRLFDSRLVARVDRGREASSIAAWSDKERETILDHFRDHFPALYPFVFFRFWTGTRPSEAIALRWKSVDLERRRVRIVASRVLGRDGRTKTGKSNREVILHRHVVEVLERIQPAHLDPEAFVFATPSGGSINETNFTNRIWQKVLRETKVRPLSFYSTRHTYISWLLANGARPLFVCRQVGTSLAMIETRYGDARMTPEQLDSLGGPTTISEEPSEDSSSRNPAGTFPESTEATETL